MSYITSVRKNTLFFLATIGIINTILAIIAFFYFNKQQNELLYFSKLDLAKTEFSQTNKRIIYEIQHYTLVLNALKESRLLQEIISGKDIELKYLNEDFKDFVKANKNIFQLRYLDEKGSEIVRVERLNNQVKSVSNLQNKASRYYFQKTKEMNNSQFYISDFDLNIEHGEIETPFKPTIRVSTPVYKDNNFKGILIINFLASDLISYIKEKKDFDVYFMDKEGNFLLHPNEEKSWSTQRGTNYKVKDEIFNIDNLIKNENNIDKNWLYYINKVQITDNDFYIIYSIKDQIYKSFMKETTKNISIFFLIIFIISIPFVLTGAYLQSIRMRILDKLINNIPFPICLKDKNGNFLLVNDALVKLYGCTSKDQLAGKNSYEFLNQNLPYTSKQNDIKALKKKKIKFVETVELKNNTKLYYDTRIIKMSFLGFFNKVFILGIAIDITAMKILNEKLQEKVHEELEKRLETEKELAQKAKLAEMGNMIDNILHQWKQPLSIIKLSSQALELDGQMKTFTLEQKEHYLTSIVENIDFMSETADDFRSFLSPEKIKSEFRVEECIAKILKLLSSRIRKQTVTLINELDKNFTIYGYKNELSQVILNILNNALDAFDESNNEKVMKLSSFEDKDNFYIQIEDNAGGIDQEHINKIFEERFTTKEKKGTGIGLTISKRIIKDSFKGDITVKNNPQGAIFTIRLAIN